MICKPNKWSDTEYGGFLNNIFEEKNIITGLGIKNEHKIKI